jgi:hypothetical protein
MLMVSRQKAVPEAGSEPDIQGAFEALSRRVERFANERGEIPLVIVEVVLIQLMRTLQDVMPRKKWPHVGRTLRASLLREADTPELAATIRRTTSVFFQRGGRR